jgi:general secretion pathway protein H
MYPPRQREVTIDRYSMQGFTLLELLVVVVIVAILFTYTTLAIRGNSPEELVQEEAQRLEQLVRLALEEATLRGEEYGIEFELNGYRFVRFTNNQWASLNTDKIFKGRTLPKNMEVELSLEDTEIVIDQADSKSSKKDSKDGDDDSEDSDSEETEKIEPQVFLLSSGEISPEFTVRFYILGVETSYLVNGLFDGSLNSEVSDL